MPQPTRKKVISHTSRLQKLRLTGHLYHDLIIRYKAYYTRGSVKRWRSRRYKWLSKKLGITKEECHFSLLTETQLELAINILSLEFSDNDNMIEFAERWESGHMKHHNPVLSKHNKSETYYQTKRP